MTIFPKLFHIKKHTDYLFQLTSLYMLGRNVSGMGIGKQSILFFGRNDTYRKCLCVKVLKNAPWSINFYYKMGFMDISNEMEKGNK